MVGPAGDLPAIPSSVAATGGDLGSHVSGRDKLVAMPLSAGERLGPYEILAVIGKGGMGEVYRAQDRRLDRDVAVKILPQAFVTEAARERFQREARAASALNHPNICAVYDVGEAAGHPFLVICHMSSRVRDTLIIRCSVSLCESVPSVSSFPHSRSLRIVAAKHSRPACGSYTITGMRRPRIRSGLARA